MESRVAKLAVVFQSCMGTSRSCIILWQKRVKKLAMKQLKLAIMTLKIWQESSNKLYDYKILVSGIITAKFLKVLSGKERVANSLDLSNTIQSFRII